MSASSEPLLTVADLAELLAVKPSWVYAQVEDPDTDLPHLRLGRRYVRFERSAIEEYLARQRRGFQVDNERDRGLRVL